MKIFKALTLSLALYSCAVLAQDDKAAKEEKSAEEPAAKEDATEGATEGETVPEGETNKDESPDIVENKEGEGKKTKTFEPAGALTRDYQYIFDQGTVSFDGFDIVDPDNTRKTVGRLDGQTGWTGVNQAGDKTMSFQIAFVIKADKSIAQIFNPATNGRQENQTTQIGWWIPSRDQDIPAEEYTMQLLDVNLYPSLWTSTIRSLQTKYRSGLYDKPLDILPLPLNTAEKKKKEETTLEEIWRFNEDGVMDSATPTEFSKLT